MTEPDRSRNITEWLKVLLDEIDRKKEEGARADEERHRRAARPDRAADESQDR